MTKEERNEMESMTALAGLTSTPCPLVKPIFESAGLSWNSLRVYSESCPPPPDRIFEPSLPEHCIILHVANSDRLERRLDGGRWLSSPSHPGGITFVPAYQTAEWLWDAEVELLHLYVPPKLIERVAIESFGVAAHRVELIDRFATRDPLLEQMALTLKAELERQSMASQLYLESIQNVLAVHLLRNHCSVEIPSVPVKGGLPQYKLRQVINYIQSHLSNDLGLAELADVMQMSPYHFGKLFKQSTGMAPHRYILRCRVDAAMSVYLNRFLNVPPARLPDPKDTVAQPELLLDQLPELLDRQQQVNETGRLVAQYLYSGGKPQQLMAILGKVMLRENRDFHVIQSMEAAFRLYAKLGDTPEGVHVLVATARYLAAHAPTMRSQEQTYQMAYRLHRGDRLFEET